MILAGDVGGTKTLLGFFRRVDGKLRCVREGSFKSRGYPSLVAIVEEFLAADRQKATRFVVGVAGPVVDGRSHVVNLRWPVDARRLSRRLGINPVRVVNDLEATAWGIPELPTRKTVSLTPGLRGRRESAALIAAGTGLGMALMPWDGQRYSPTPSEGGHQDFSPRDDLEIELLEFMRRRHGRVSTERVVAGPGVSAIYQFLIESGRGKESRRMADLLAEATDPNAAIAEAALDRLDPLAERTLDLFISLYGAAAGDLALVARAVGGVYVGGGIAPKILPRLRGGGFIRAFRAKGRLTPLLEQISVRVILEPRTALIGAAARAERLPVSRKIARRPQSRRRVDKG